MTQVAGNEIGWVVEAEEEVRGLAKKIENNRKRLEKMETRNEEAERVINALHSILIRESVERLRKMMGETEADSK